MEPISSLFLALLGAAMVGGWIGWTRHVADRDRRAEREVWAAKAQAVEAAPVLNCWTGQPSIYADMIKYWSEETPVVVRVSRCGFGTHLARTPARARRFSPYVYRTMWAGLHR